MIKLYNHPEFYNINHTFPGEIWKSVNGFEDYYMVSTSGRIKVLERLTSSNRLRKSLCLKQARSYSKRRKQKTYFHLCFIKNKIRTNHLVHRVVLEAFTPNIENKLECNHVNGDILDNRIENLEWNTRSENVLHAYRLKLCPHGETHNFSKLTRNEVLEIRRLSKISYKNRKLADKFNMSMSTINRIVKGKTWKHLL